MAETNEEGDSNAIEDLEAQLNALDTRVAAIEKRLSHIVALGEEFWRGEAALLLLGAAVKSWRYNVRDSDVPFADVFKCERYANGFAKRWVGKSGEIGATVAINRAVPLIFGVRIHDFAVPEMVDSLTLQVDDSAAVCSFRGDDLWLATIEPRLGHAYLKFRLAVDESSFSTEQGVSFSFSEVFIVPQSEYDQLAKASDQDKSHSP